jgi:hypothetical protein
VIRAVTVFSNQTDQLIHEFPLPDIELQTLRDLWGAAESDPMIHEFEIGRAQKEFFQQVLGIELDLQEYSYFISFQA